MSRRHCSENKLVVTHFRCGPSAGAEQNSVISFPSRAPNDQQFGQIQRNHEPAFMPLEKHRRRNVESFAQFLDVGFAQSAFLVKDLGHRAFETKDGGKVFLAKIIGVHERAKDRRSIGNEMVFFFVRFNQNLCGHLRAPWNIRRISTTLVRTR